MSEILGSTEEPESYFRTVTQSQNLKAQGQAKAPIRWGKFSQLARKVSQNQIDVGKLNYYYLF